MVLFKPALNLPRDMLTLRRLRLQWRPSALSAGLIASLALIAIFNLSKQSEFLYFQF